MSETKIFIISGPSGAGKTTLLKLLFQKRFIQKNFLLSISFTTRPRRKGEEEGRDYFFVERHEFLLLKKKGFFLETQKVLEHHYGSPRYFLQKAQKQKKNLILCIDVKGGKYLKNNFREGKIVTIFVSAPEEELSLRLRKRREVTKNIEKRVKLAKKELQYLKYYDYLIINQSLNESIKNLEAILKAELLKRR